MANKASSKQILHWLRTYFDVPFDDITGAKNGAMFCQVLDSMHRGKVPLNTVNFDAKSERQMDNNYKILDKVLERTGMDYKLNAEALKSGNVKESLAFWQYLFFHWGNSNAIARKYDAPKKRRRAREARYAKLGLDAPKDDSDKKSSKSDGSGSVKAKKSSSSTKKKSSDKKLPSLRLSQGALADAALNKQQYSPTESIRSSRAGSPRESQRARLDDEERTHIGSIFPDAAGLSFMAPAIDSGANDDPLAEKLLELAESISGMTLERNTYFSKLRRIEKALERYQKSSKLGETLETILMRPPPLFGRDEEDNVAYESSDED